MIRISLGSIVVMEFFGNLNADLSYLINDKECYETVDSSDTALNKNVIKMFKNLSTTVYQKFLDVSAIENINYLSEQLKIDIKYASISLQPPGSINCIHVDKFHKLKEKYNGENPVRANIFLSKWEYGQLVQTPSNSYHNWKVGNYTIWDETVQHFAINFSLFDKYTLQFSGFPTI